MVLRANGKLLHRLFAIAFTAKRVSLFYASSIMAS